MVRGAMWNTRRTTRLHIIANVHQSIVRVIHIVTKCFGWSCFVTQTALLGICEQAGLSPDALLACDREAPVTSSIAFAVATDDIS